MSKRRTFTRSVTWKEYGVTIHQPVLIKAVNDEDADKQLAAALVNFRKQRPNAQAR